MFGRKANATTLNRRNAVRHDYNGECRVQLEATTIRGRCLNISDTGAAIELRSLGMLAANQMVRFYVGHAPVIDGRVRWARGRSIGIEFDTAEDGFNGLRALLAEIQAEASE